jgi:formylmethanofuran dehydrogenase subunit C
MTLTFKLRAVPEVPLEAENISPDKLSGLDAKAAAKLPAMLGNRMVALGDFFEVSGKANGEIRAEGDLAKVKYLGAGMTAGKLVIAGNAGPHLGSAMTGGEIEVEGNAGDWVGPEMLGGRIVVRGNAGHMVGSAQRGSRVGMMGGDIIVHGNCGNETGNTMRNGLIAIGGNCGDYAGANMLAGTIVVLGQLGIRFGAGMKRGSIVAMHEAELLPTFTYACTYRPTFLRLYLYRLRDMGLKIADKHITGRYKRWSGDAVELNRGEALIFDG